MILQVLKSKGLVPKDAFDITNCAVGGQCVMMMNASVETNEMMSLLKKGDDGQIAGIESVYANAVFIERKAKEIQRMLEKWRSPNAKPLAVKDNSYYVRGEKFADGQ